MWSFFILIIQDFLFDTIFVIIYSKFDRQQKLSHCFEILLCL